MQLKVYITKDKEKKLDCLHTVGRASPNCVLQFTSSYNSLVLTWSRPKYNASEDPQTFFYENYIVPTYILYFVFFYKTICNVKIFSKRGLACVLATNFWNNECFPPLVITKIYNDSLIFMIMNTIITYFMYALKLWITDDDIHR